MINLILAVLFLILSKIEKSETWKFRWALVTYFFGILATLEALFNIISHLGNG